MNNKSTHWIHADLDMDSLPEAIGKTPEEAARLHVKGDNPSDDSSDDRHYLTLDGYVKIKLHGLLETTEIITDSEHYFDGYEPGQTWYKKTGETKTVRVSLKFEVVELLDRAEAMFGVYSADYLAKDLEQLIKKIKGEG